MTIFIIIYWSWLISALISLFLTNVFMPKVWQVGDVRSQILPFLVVLFGPFFFILSLYLERYDKKYDDLKKAISEPLFDIDEFFSNIQEFKKNIVEFNNEFN